MHAEVEQYPTLALKNAQGWGTDAMSIEAIFPGLKIETGRAQGPALSHDDANCAS